MLAYLLFRPLLAAVFNKNTLSDRDAAPLRLEFDIGRTNRHT